MVTYTGEVVRVLREAGRLRPRGDYFREKSVPLRERPTVSQWLRAHPAGEYLIIAAGHLMHVRDGRHVEHNGHPTWRGRVTHVLKLPT